VICLAALVVHISATVRSVFPVFATRLHVAYFPRLVLAQKRKLTARGRFLAFCKDGVAGQFFLGTLKFWRVEN
jgi:hypothetical protein